MMKSIFVACLGVAALAVSSSVSEAADGCGRGWHYNGYRCAPMYRDGRPGVYIYRERPRYRGGYDVYDRGHPYGYNYDYGDPRCGQPNYTIQDGVCKPYTGR